MSSESLRRLQQRDEEQSFGRALGLPCEKIKIKSNPYPHLMIFGNIFCLEFQRSLMLPLSSLERGRWMLISGNDRPLSST
jgi:hypothetical protein